MKKRKKILATGLVIVAMSSVLLLSGCTFGKSIDSAGTPSGFFRKGFQAYCSSLYETKETILKNSQGYQAFMKLHGGNVYVAETAEPSENSVN